MKRMLSKTLSNPFKKSTKTQNSSEPTVNPILENALPPWWTLNEPAPSHVEPAPYAAEQAPAHVEPAPFRSEPVMAASSGVATEREPYTASTSKAQLRNYFFSETPAWDQSLPVPPNTPARQRAQAFFKTKADSEKNIIGRGGRRKTRKRKYRKNKK